MSDGNKDTIEIRRVLERDYDQFQTLSRAIIQDLSQYYPYEVIKNYNDIFARYFRGAFTKNTTYALGAFIGNQPVGLIVGEERSRLLHIELIGVIPKKMGIGRKLLSAFEDIAKSKNLYCIYLVTSLKNIPAVSFYLKCGYNIDWVQKNFWYGWHYIQLSKQIYIKDWGEADLLSDATRQSTIL